jgi:O-ureido-D-serine cyclo-ligase
MTKPIDVALVTADAARDQDEDLPPLAAALERVGARVSQPSWDDATIDWSQFSIAVVRSTWDYTERLPDFLAWGDRVARLTQLHNPMHIVRWNTDKLYLLDLERAGLPIIPSLLARPGEAATLPTANEVVVKPSVGAGSRGAKRFRASDARAALAHAAKLQVAGFTVLAQPYLDSVDQLGETALLFIDGEFSHSIRKGPLLMLDGGEVTGLFARENIKPRVAAADELEVARAAVAAVPGGAPLYARVDLIRDAHGKPRILELELTEPSFFFAHGAGSADRFAARLLARVA